MTALTLLACLVAADPWYKPERVLDDASLQLAAERSVELGMQLLRSIPDSRSKSVRPRVQSLVADAILDRNRLRARNGATTTTDEAAILFNYGELCRIGIDVLGESKLGFLQNPNRPWVEEEAKSGRDKVRRQSFDKTLQTPEQVFAIVDRARAVYKTIESHEKRDTLSTAKWRGELAKLRKELDKAEDDLRLPTVEDKSAAEGAVYANYARALGMLQRVER